MDSVIGRIEAAFSRFGLLEKSFLWASLLPIATLAVAATLVFGAVVGLESLIGSVARLSAYEKGFLAGASLVGLLVCAIVLYGLRAFLLQLWCGAVWPLPLRLLLRALTCRQKRRYTSLKNQAYRPMVWEHSAEHFLERVEKLGNEPTGSLSEADLRKVVEKLEPEDGSWDQVEGELLNQLTGRDKKLVHDLRAIVLGRLDELERAEAFEMAQAQWRFDRSFGTANSIRPTALGNIVESYVYYPFDRYRMDGQILWLHLQAVIPRSHRASITDAGAFLDFNVSMASVWLAFAAGCLLGGPWLWDNQWLWLLLAASGAGVSLSFYRIAVRAAANFGEVVRASFDLFRSRLLERIASNRRALLNNEQQAWEEISQVLAYRSRPWI